MAGPAFFSSSPAGNAGEKQRVLRYAALCALCAALWWLVYSHVQAASSWLVFDVLKIPASSRLGPALEFFLYDTAKILLLLIALIYVIAWLRAGLDTERVRGFLAGRKNGEQVEEEMCKASVFAMSSSSEGFPFVLLEAQSCALPILAYDVRVGPGFIVHESEDGYLVPEGDEATYERRMLEMMGNTELLRKMGHNALIHAREFSEDKVADKWYSVIET